MACDEQIDQQQAASALLGSAREDEEGGPGGTGGAEGQPVPRFASLLQPLDEERKAGLPNCTVCRGCNVELRDMSETPVRFQNVLFQHGKGATNSYLYFAQVPGISKRFIVKVRGQCVGPS